MSICINKLLRIVTQFGRIPVAFILLASLSLSSCGEDTKPAEESTSQQWRSPIISPEIIKEVHEKQLKELPEYKTKNLAGFSIAKITEIHYYLYNQRWNTGGDISMTGGTNYEEAAEDLQIPAPQLEEADFYYDNQIQPQLSTLLQTLLKDHPHIKLDFYSPLTPSAYCGVNTVLASIMLFDKKEENALKKDAAGIAERFKTELPEWVDGFKLNYTTVSDTILKTNKRLDIGFLWKRGENIHQMNASDGAYGYRKPTENTFWHSDEWNHLREIKQPVFREIHPKTGN